MAEIKPLLNGLASRIGDDHIEWSLALSHEMDGWVIDKAEVDATGYFLNVTFKRVEDG